MRIAIDREFTHVGFLGGLMLNLIERSLASMADCVVLVAPNDAIIPAGFRNLSCDSSRRARIVREMQTLRGTIYVQEGYAKSDELLPDGRYELSEDEACWHVLMTDRGGRIRSCALYFDHPNTAAFNELRVRHCTLATRDGWREMLRGAVEAEMSRARRAGFRFAELGGWVIERRYRRTGESLIMGLATYALSRMLGGSLGITTATLANSSSSTLQQMGGSRLEYRGAVLPSYFDERYQTEMELLRFDSRCPNMKHNELIDIAQRKLAQIPVIAESADSMPASNRFQRVGAFGHVVGL